MGEMLVEEMPVARFDLLPDKKLFGKASASDFLQLGRRSYRTS